MRVGFIGVSHWHSKHFLTAIAAREGEQIVGVADTSREHAQRWGRQLGVEVFSDYRQMCERARPELAIVLGRPVDMARTAEYLIESGIPAIIEKPCGTTVSDVRRLEELADGRHAFLSVPLPLRYGLLARLIAEQAPGEEVSYASFRVLSGTPGRYRDWGLSWNLDPALAGGGSTLNIGSLYLDFIRYLAPSAAWKVKSASMSNALTSVAVEDFSSILLESSDPASTGRRAAIETGYVFPRQAEGTEEGVDVSVALCVGDRYFRMLAPDRILVRDQSGAELEYHSGLTQSPWYAAYLDDTIARLRDGRPPAITMHDMYEVALLARDAYRQTDFDACMAEPNGSEQQ